MTLSQTAAAFLQQAEGDGITFDSFDPLAVSGPDEVIAKYSVIITHLRDKAAAHPSRPDFNRALAVAAETMLGPQERELRRQVGRPGMVWLNASPFHFGRIEAVVKGIALVTVHPEPLLSLDPMASWLARTENALPFHVGLIELDHIDDVISDGTGRVLEMEPRQCRAPEERREAS